VRIAKFITVLLSRGARRRNDLQTKNEPRPDPTANDRTQAVRALTLNFLLVIILIVVLKLGKPLLTPIALSAFLYLLLMPVMKLLLRLKIPRSPAALAVIVLACGLLGLGVVQFAEPAAKWIDEIPRALPSIKSKLTPVSKPIQKIGEAASEVENLTQIDSLPRKETVLIADPGILEAVIEATPELVVSLGVMLFLTFFLLVYGERLGRKVAELGRSFPAQRKLLRIGRDIQGELSRFLGTIALINVGLGVVAALVFWLLDVPNFLLWGGAVAIANFVPYVGAAAMFVVLAAVGLISFDSLGEAIRVPLSFLLLTIVEGQLVTPILVGRRLDLSPLVIFVAVIFWSYLWGLVGAIVAVPIVASTKIVLHHVSALRPVAKLFSR
jgi:predicted PurR-regulated permease PerM